MKQLIALIGLSKKPIPGKGLKRVKFSIINWHHKPVAYERIMKNAEAGKYSFWKSWTNERLTHQGIHFFIKGGKLIRYEIEAYSIYREEYQL